MAAYPSRYEIVAQALEGIQGSLLDIGSRDRILKNYLGSSLLEYKSSDLSPGHDFQWNLEQPLPSPDCAYDVVVALEVLEHVENIHASLRELVRVARRKVFISLPNMACLTFRWDFFRSGFLGDKYSLLPQHQGDRHRWLTTYDNSLALVRSICASELGCEVVIRPCYLGYTKVHNLALRLPLHDRLKTFLVVFEITKPGAISDGPVGQPAVAQGHPAKA